MMMIIMMMAKKTNSVSSWALHANETASNDIDENDDNERQCVYVAQVDDAARRQTGRERRCQRALGERTRATQMSTDVVVDDIQSWPADTDMFRG